MGRKQFNGNSRYQNGNVVDLPERGPGNKTCQRIIKPKKKDFLYQTYDRFIQYIVTLL
jgi:hypothetical protein